MNVEKVKNKVLDMLADNMTTTEQRVVLCEVLDMVYELEGAVENDLAEAFQNGVDSHHL